eukprot:TRINITY_DN2432_c0_g1_i1.p1 TRINITY_DN2432_c0_g1~~TRINITY_DN2432_c0_g1_i1.p1  ORF type:complete len:996 (-),score=301.56 TRINITY_DN2432_c0_g1_i1:97-3084(-)
MGVFFAKPKLTDSAPDASLEAAADAFVAQRARPAHAAGSPSTLITITPRSASQQQQQQQQQLTQQQQGYYSPSGGSAFPQKTPVLHSHIVTGTAPLGTSSPILPIITSPPTSALTTVATFTPVTSATTATAIQTSETTTTTRDATPCASMPCSPVPPCSPLPDGKGETSSECSPISARSTPPSCIRNTQEYNAVTTVRKRMIDVNDDDALAEDEPLPRVDSMINITRPNLNSNPKQQVHETLLASPFYKIGNTKKTLANLPNPSLKVAQPGESPSSENTSRSDNSNQPESSQKNRSGSWLLGTSPKSGISPSNSECNTENDVQSHQSGSDISDDETSTKDNEVRVRPTEVSPKGSREISSLNDGYYTKKESEMYEINIEPNSVIPTSEQIQWKRGLPIGQGAFGTVFSGLNVNTGEMLAVKICPVVKNQKAMKQLEEFYKEVGVLRLLKHENIVRFLGASVKEENLFIFLEYIPSGSISSLLLKFGPFSESVVKLYTRQILEGLQYLHNCKIVHRDIKGANILVDSNGVVKLTDFGSSNLLKSVGDQKDLRTSLKGTPNWMAPEVVKQTGAGRKSDIWSVGCTVVEMSTGKPPWSEYNNQVTVIYKIAKALAPELPDGLSLDCLSFVNSCLTIEPLERPTAKKLLEHHFVATAHALHAPKSNTKPYDDVFGPILLRASTEFGSSNEQNSNDESLETNAMAMPNRVAAEALRKILLEKDSTPTPRENPLLITKREKKSSVADTSDLKIDFEDDFATRSRSEPVGSPTNSESSDHDARRKADISSKKRVSTIPQELNPVEEPDEELSNALSPTAKKQLDIMNLKPIGQKCPKLDFISSISQANSNSPRTRATTKISDINLAEVKPAPARRLSGRVYPTSFEPLSRKTLPPITSIPIPSVKEHEKEKDKIIEHVSPRKPTSTRASPAAAFLACPQSDAQMRMQKNEIRRPSTHAGRESVADEEAITNYVRDNAKILVGKLLTPLANSFVGRPFTSPSQ